MKILASILSVILLSACSHLANSPSADQKEAQALALVGLSEADALARVKAAGFVCEAEASRGFGMRGYETGRVQVCMKKTAEAVCPKTIQLEFLTLFNVGKVTGASSRMEKNEEKSCS